MTDYATLDKFDIGEPLVDTRLNELSDGIAFLREGNRVYNRFLLPTSYTPLSSGVTYTEKFDPKLSVRIVTNGGSLRIRGRLIFTIGSSAVLVSAAIFIDTQNSSFNRRCASPVTPFISVLEFDNVAYVPAGAHVVGFGLGTSNLTYQPTISGDYMNFILVEEIGTFALEGRL